jgi:hypothetical protein
MYDGWAWCPRKVERCNVAAQRSHNQVHEAILKIVYSCENLRCGRALLSPNPSPPEEERGVLAAR